MYSRNDWKYTTALASILSLATTKGYATSFPDHGHFVSGQGSFAKGNQSLTVKQSSTTGIINWSSFSVGKKSSVTFDNGSGATLNRVTGGSLSTIAGSLHATGSLYLMNSAGAIVSGTGHIVTGGDFVATSGNVGDSAFGDGDRRFKPGIGKVLNRGTIVSGGSVSLVGRNVSDSGSIRAAGVEISATQWLGISGSITTHTGDGSGGTITARAQTIVLGTDGDLNASATSANQQGGTISIVARGTATVAGILTAQGGGGFIETSGEHLHVADSAKVSTRAVNGKAGTWLIDPQDFTIAASGGDITGAELSNELASNDVDIQSSAGAKAGAGDIFVDDTVTWSSGSTLTLDAYHSIHIDAPITVAGIGGLTITTDDGGKNGDYEFGLGANGFSGHVAFTDVIQGNTKGSLTINGAVFHLVNSLDQLAKKLDADNQNYTEDWALANSDDTDGSHVYDLSPISVVIEGTIEGLGNSISNVVIDDNKQADVGIFGEIAGNIRDIGILNATVVGGQQGNVGGLVGVVESFGELAHDYVSGQISAGEESNVGGLVGFSTARIFDSHANVSVLGETEGTAGGLVGTAVSGFITDSSASAFVGGSDASGGLVGSSDVEIKDSFATGEIGGDGSSGGLVGSNGGKILNSFAFATVLNGGQPNGYGGGLVGDNSGSIISSFSIGQVEGANANGGGLVGAELSAGKVKLSYWDTETSGLANASFNKHHLSGAVGETTAELQSGLLSGLSEANWGIVAGESFPYLNWQFPSGAPQAVSGIDYDPASRSPSVDANIKVAVDGTLVDPVIAVPTGANGYYYDLLAPGTVSLHSDLFVYVDNDAGAAVGAGMTSDLNITDGYFSEISDSDLYSSMQDQVKQAIGGNAALIAIRKRFSNLAIVGDGTSLTINKPVDVKAGGTLVVSTAGNLAINGELKARVLDLSSAGEISENNRGKVVADVLLGSSVDGTSLSSANAIKQLAGFTNSGRGGFALEDYANLDVTGAVDAGADDLSLDADGSGGSHRSLSINAALTAGGEVLLESTKNITENASTGRIIATTLDGLAEQTASFDGQNSVSNFGFSANAGLGFVNAKAVTILGMTSENGNIVVKTEQGGITFGKSADLFASNGSITFDSAGELVSKSGAAIFADSIGGYATGGAMFVGDYNSVGDFTNTGGGQVVFESGNNEEVRISGTVNAGSAEVKIPVGQFNTIAIDGTLETTGTVYLYAQYIARGFSGSIIAHEVTGEVVGNGGYADVGGTIAVLGPFTSSGEFSLEDSRSVTVIGAISSSGYLPALDISTTSGGITINSTLTGGYVSLNSAAGIAEGAHGLIITPEFSGQAAGNVALQQNNQIADIQSFSNSNGNITLNTAEPLSTSGEVQAQAPGNLISLTTTTGGITISGSLHASEVDLKSAAAIDASSGAIVASTLTGSSFGAANLGGSQNMIGTLGAFSTNSAGDFTLSDAEALAVSGTVNVGAHDIGLTTTSGNVAIDAELDAGTVNLTSAGQATETSAGAIKTDLLNVAAQTGISLTSSNNDIVTIGTDTTKSGPNNITQ